MTEGPHKRGFSIIELIGVMAVLAILAGAMAPAVLRQTDRAAKVRETANLSTMAATLTQYIIRSNTIPQLNNADPATDPNSWAQVIGSEMTMAPASIYRNSRGFVRIFMIDQSGWLAGNLPYIENQPPYGVMTAPTNCRVMILSTIDTALPSTLTNYPSSGGQAVFNDIWSTPYGSLPTNSIWSGASGYKGNYDDLLIQRINLDPLFHRVALVNGDTNLNGQGYYSANGGSPIAVPGGGTGFNAYHLDGTVLGLHFTNRVLMYKEVIRSDISRIFERGIWRDEIGIGIVSNGVPDFTVIAAAFFNAPSCPGAQWGATPRGVSDALGAFMYGYATWASENICFTNNGYSGSTANNNYGKFTPEFAMMQSALGAFTGANGGASLFNYPSTAVPGL
ncbi:MAG: hypothetical protein C5B50_02515 [Verrucomicrobia bacterium]|nr:MAG: hypothetical protein C5B50_02515 [Verrucomicrobiota bacterium]